MDKFFEGLCLDYHERVFKYLYYSLKDLDDAKDITQEVFLHIYENLDKVIDHENIGGYIFQTAKFKKMNYVRRLSTKYGREITNFIDNKASHPDIYTELGIAADKKIDETLYIDNVLNQLDEKKQELYRLRYINNMSYKDIADRLGIRETSVRMRYVRLKREVVKITKSMAKKNFVTYL